MTLPDAIPVDIPHRWIWFGRCFVFAVLLASAIMGYRLLVVQSPVSEIYAFNSALHFLLTPLVLPLFSPFFVGAFPPLVVAIYGERFLHRLIADCVMLLGSKRVGKASAWKPAGWIDDQRVVWTTIIVGCILLGVLTAIQQ